MMALVVNKQQKFVYCLDQTLHINPKIESACNEVRIIQRRHSIKTSLVGQVVQIALLQILKSV
jgi:hypothetical protein